MSEQSLKSAGGPLEQDRLRARKYRGPRTVMALILREMSTSYGRSPGGYLWAIVDPVAGLLLMSLIFSVAFRNPPLGNSFPLFYATGFLPFMMFNSIANKMATSINFSRNLLAYPAVTFVDALVARLILAFLTHMMVFYIIFSVLIFVLGARSQLDLPNILLGMTCITALAVGIGTLNCYLMTTFPIWERAWQILTRPLFLISGIFFMYGDLPKVAQEVVWYNPLIHAVGLTRSGFYAAYKADYVSLVFIFAVAVTTMTLGMLLLWRNYRTLLEH
ncbi:ABC transporter permease [Ponticoccus gilvus]|nr:ABC transporter permease [Enemella evansiae]